MCRLIWFFFEYCHLSSGLCTILRSTKVSHARNKTVRSDGPTMIFGSFYSYYIQRRFCKWGCTVVYSIDPIFVTSNKVNELSHVTMHLIADWTLPTHTHYSQKKLHQDSRAVCDVIVQKQGKTTIVQAFRETMKFGLVQTYLTACFQVLNENGFDQQKQK